MKISQAINLRKQMQKNNSPEVKLLCTVKDGCTLWIKADLYEGEDYDNLVQFAKENKLSWGLEQGYWILFG
jgi:hypothetical protein